MIREHTRRGEQPLSNTEAIRRAIEALGPSGQVTEILDYIHAHFGIGFGAAGPAATVVLDNPAGGHGRRQESLAGEVAAPEGVPSPARKAGGKRGKPQDPPA